MHDVPSVVTQDDEGEKYAKGRGGYSKKVNCNDVANMVVQKGWPSRRWRLARTDSVSVYRRLGDDVAKEREFRLDARRSPQRILTRYALDQPSNLGFDLGSADLAGSRLPSPIQLEALPMPSNYGARLHDEQSGAPIGPNSGQQRPEDSITLSQARRFQLLLQDRELLPKRGILDGKIDSITNQGPDEEDHRTKQPHFTRSRCRNHGPETIAKSSEASIRNSCVDNGYGIFGMDRLCHG
ncbi:MAG: hypothetical protein V1790_04560 [Planctomycetota bacterium]